jgi:hemerythrin-like domain-containing protein
MSASNMLQALQRDHVNFGKVLAVLREELAILEAHESPDFEHIKDALEYLQEYGNLYHHPKEDAIYHYHLEHHDNEWNIIEKLLDEHSKLERITEDLRLATEGMLHDVVTRRDHYIDKLGSFVESQSKHLEVEETRVFPMIRDAFSDEDWAAVEQQWPTPDDPLFGAEVKEPFRVLYARIAKI